MGAASFDVKKTLPTPKTTNIDKITSPKNTQTLRKIAIKPVLKPNRSSKQGTIATVFTPENYQRSAPYQRARAEDMSETRPTKVTLKFRNEVQQQLMKYEQQQQILEKQKQNQLQAQLDLYRKQQKQQHQENGTQHTNGNPPLSDEPIVVSMSKASSSSPMPAQTPLTTLSQSTPAAIHSPSPPSQSSSPVAGQAPALVSTPSTHIPILPATSFAGPDYQMRTTQHDDHSSLSFLPPMTLPPNTQSHPQYFKDLKPVRPPRSKEFYRIGPNFERTCQNFDLCDPNGVPVYTIISARFDRGFKKFPNSDSWLSYRRNYFTLTSCFSLVQKGNFSIGKIPPFPVYAVQDGKVKSKVLSFAIRITALRVCIDGDVEELPLVQHTAKRDKGPRDAPAIVPAIPGLLPDHNFMRNNTHYRSSSRLQKIEPFFYRKVGPELGPFCENYPPDDKVAHVVLHDRVQFTTAGGGGSQICKAVVQLIATLEDNISYVVAWSETQPFTLRNRSPGNYYEDGTLIPRAKKALYAKTYGEDGEEEVKNENPDENNPEKKLNDLLMKHALALSHSFLKDYRELEEDSDCALDSDDADGQSDTSSASEEPSKLADHNARKSSDSSVNKLPATEPLLSALQAEMDHPPRAHNRTPYSASVPPVEEKLPKTIKPPGPGQTTFSLIRPSLPGMSEDNSNTSVGTVFTAANSPKNGSESNDQNDSTRPQQSTIRVHLRPPHSSVEEETGSSDP
jgi:meiosis-specific transcription factor NDT80